MSRTANTSISGTVTHTVTLGRGGFGDTLTVTGTGLVTPEPVAGRPATYGAVGVNVRTQTPNASLTNFGTISGGAGGFGGGPIYDSGGIGVKISGLAATINNSGSIAGGMGAYVASAGNITPTEGGAAIDLTAASFNYIMNRGTAIGGKGGSTATQAAGAGGVGIDVAGAGTLSNTGFIGGGAGGDCQGSSFAAGGAGGNGIDLSSAGDVLNNHGLILGGSGGLGGNEGGGYYGDRGAWGTGAELSNDAQLFNHGVIGGGIGVEASQSGTISNGGTIFSTYGGAGVALLSGAVLNNDGEVRAGSQLFDYTGDPLNGSAGVVMGSSTTLSNFGTVTGGEGGGASYSGTRYYGAGGAGVDVTAAADVRNDGLIVGGQSYNQGGQGGVGVELAAGSLLDNRAIIEGALGETGGGGGVVGTDANVFNSGQIIGGEATSYGTIFYDGGVGLEVTGCDTTNTGLIQGGINVSATYLSGVGVAMDGGTLTNSGTISGGVSYGYTASALTAQDGATLILEPGAVFNGRVVAMDHGDTLDLGGTLATSLGGIGSEYIGFSSIDVLGGAKWNLTEANNLGTGSSLAVGGGLTVLGSLTDGTAARVVQGGGLTAGSGGSILIDGVVIAGGVLSGSATGSLAIGNDPAGLTAGSITVEAGASISGFGQINGANGVIDNGIIIARAGTLIVGVPITGTGALDIANGAAVNTGGSVSVANVEFVNGTGETLYVGRPAFLGSTISGFATGDKIELNGITATTLTYFGGTLTLYDNANIVDTLHFTGNLLAADFVIKQDGVDTDILYNPSLPTHLDIAAVPHTERDALALASHWGFLHNPL